MGSGSALSAPFLRFLLTGGLAALVNLGARYVLDMAMAFEWAVGLAYLAGMATAYTLSRRYVFPGSGRPLREEALRFGMVNAGALLLVMGVSSALSRGVFPALGFTWHADDIAHLAGVCLPAVTSYLGHRHFTFSRVAAKS
jgi:putative flippase GtrA